MIKLGHEVEFDGRMWVVTEFCEEPNTGLAVLTPQPAFLSESTYALPKARTVPVALLDLLEAWKRSDGIHAGRADEYKARVTALEEEVRDAEAKHQKAFEDGLEIVRKANARIAALESESAQYREAAEKAREECERRGARVLMGWLWDNGHLYGSSDDREGMIHAALAKPHEGWAPGNYQNKCCVCESMFLGDKRAVVCLACADAARIAALESESAQYREAAEKEEKECERLLAESKRWRAMFEHAAQLIADEIDAYGLAGDEATEEIERWAARAAGEG